MGASGDVAGGEAGGDGVVEAAARRLAAVVAVAFDGRLLEGPAHALGLAVGPRAVEPGQPVRDAVPPGRRLRPMRRTVAGLILAVLFYACAVPTGLAQRPLPGDAPVLFKSDSLSYDRAGETVTAQGNVEIVRGERILRADAVTYDRRADRVTARGNVSILDPSGDVVFADSVEVSGDLKDGVAEGVRLRFADNARLAAAAGRHIGGARTEMDRAVYSPCPLCDDDPTRPPTWQVKADRVVHDRTGKEVVYRDATLEMWGVPVLYTPYLSHPDPTVRRKSGLLVPVFGRDTELGLIAKTPVFVNIAPNKDATITPIITSKEGPVGVLEYRHRFVGGQFSGKGSLTQASSETQSSTTRGHFDGGVRYDIDDTWRVGLDIAFASDDTYLGRYDFSSEKTLTSNLFYEGFRGRNYFAANAYRFQGLRATDVQETIPLVLPELDYSYFGAPDRLGGRLNVDANFRALWRETGGRNVRLSLDGGWTLPYTTADGQRLTLFARLQSDGYWVRDPPDPDDPDRRLRGFSGRLFPQVGLDWRYPFIHRGRWFSEVLEPVVGIIAAPGGGNPSKAPNEDSLDLELNETNVFARSRLTGLDLVENGQRAYYGAQLRLLTPRGLGATAFLGQSYRIDGSDLFPAGSGLEDDFSDVVGRLSLDLGRFARVLYRFRFDHDDVVFQRNEVEADIGPDYLRLSGEYLFIDGQQSPDGFADREEVGLRLATKIAENFRLAGSTRRDIAEGRSLKHRIEIGYEDDCFLITLSFARDFTEDRDIRPTDSVFLRVDLRTLGSFRGGVRPRSDG